MKDGFTLVELLVVITIIGILTSVAVPNYREYVRESQAKQMLSALLQADAMVDEYFRNARSYKKMCTLLRPGFDALAATKMRLTCEADALQYTLSVVGQDITSGLQYTLNQDGTRGTPSLPHAWVSPSEISFGAVPVSPSTSCFIIDNSGQCAP